MRSSSDLEITLGRAPVSASALKGSSIQVDLAKLKAAAKWIPEWVDYDTTIKNFETRRMNALEAEQEQQQQQPKQQQQQPQVHKDDKVDL